LPADKGFAFDIDEFKSKIAGDKGCGRYQLSIPPEDPDAGRLSTMADALKDTGILFADGSIATLFWRAAAFYQVYDKTIIVGGSRNPEHDGLAARLITTQKEISRAVLVLTGLAVCTRRSRRRRPCSVGRTRLKRQNRTREIFIRNDEFLVDLLDKKRVKATSPEELTRAGHCSWR
jgi:hypothetical protein